MNVAFRVDASVLIGRGHVQRCLTLANELRNQGHSCFFISRNHEGNLNYLVSSSGFEVCQLTDPKKTFCGVAQAEEKDNWLGVSAKVDAYETIEAIGQKKIDWIVADHYSLSSSWEKQVRAYACKLMIIDDLANRPHDCDLLLDQTIGRSSSDYSSLVSNKCKIICGEEYLMLRPEFHALRQESLKRRQSGHLKNVLVSLGGLNNKNITSSILKEFLHLNSALDLNFDVVLPNLTDTVLDIVEELRSRNHNIALHEDVEDMGKMMLKSDIAIGGAGGATWERCFLGLPSFLFVVAENQKHIASLMKTKRSAVVCNQEDIVSGFFLKKFNHFIKFPEELKDLSARSSAVVKMVGTAKIVREMESILEI